MEFFYTILIRLFVVFTALPIHEFAHGYVAYKLGDNTAKYSGRLNLNPLTHFDLIGTTMLLLTGFGFAKPVPINPRNFKNPKLGMALSALAGPVSNILLATVFLILFKIVSVAMAFRFGAFYSVMILTLNTIIVINLQLAVFNLIPIPPLDGSKVLGYFLSDKINYMMYQYQNYLMIIMIVLISTDIFNRPIGFLTAQLLTLIDFLTGWVDIIVMNIFR